MSGEDVSWMYGVEVPLKKPITDETRTSAAAIRHAVATINAEVKKLWRNHDVSTQITFDFPEDDKQLYPFERLPTIQAEFFRNGTQVMLLAQLPAIDIPRGRVAYTQLMEQEDNEPGKFNVSVRMKKPPRCNDDEHNWQKTDNWLIDRCATCGEERA